MRKSSAIIHLQAEAAERTRYHAKKKGTFHKEQYPKQVEAYLEKIKDIPKEKLVYIDQTGLQTQMYRKYAPGKRRKRANIRISGKRHAELGLLRSNVKDPCLLHTPSRGTMKAAVFEQCFEEELLNCLPKGHVIIMDNAAFHKKEVLQNLAGKCSQELIFPPP